MTDFTRNIVMLSAVVILVALSWLSVSSGTPKLWSPYNFFVLLPTWLGEPLLGKASILAGLFFVPLMFCVWCFPLFQGSPFVPIRSLILLTCFVLLSALNLFFGYEYGLRYQGRTYVLGVIAISVTCWVVLGAFAVVARHRRTQYFNIGFHTALFGWLAWYSLPTLGELP